MKIQQLIIPEVSPISNRGGSIPNQPSSNPKSASFSDVLLKSIEKVNSLQKEADSAIDELVLGDNKDIIQTIIAMEKADVSFRLMMQIRNRIIQTYEEIMRMQL